ncbi:MarR family transcriptional regulator [Rhodobacterales bacterium]|nr:MarR family transcriptional regulator [Rhodobacterales bacterium]
MKDSLIANHLGALAVKLIDDVSRTRPMSDTSRALMETLYFWGPMSATQLAEIAGLTQPSAKRALDKLREAGLVEWPDAGRTRPARLTGRGRSLVVELIADRDDVLRQATSVLTREEQMTLAPLLEKMLTALTGSPEEARHMCRFCDHAICDGPLCPVGERARALRGAHHDTA